MRLCVSGAESFAELAKLSPLRHLLRFVFSELAREKVWQDTLQELGRRPASLSLVFCDDEAMRAYNRQYRKLDRTTDILSFPAQELPGVAALYATLSPGERSLGDLIVSVPAVARGARRGKRSFSAELDEVLIHGVLHLLGMDHVQGGRRAREMRALQSRLYKAWRRKVPSRARAK